MLNFVSNLKMIQRMQTQSFLFLLCLLLISSCSMSDVRTPYQLTQTSHSPKKDTLLHWIDQQYGGLDQWKTIPGVTVTGYDEWPTFHWRLIASPWKDRKTAFEFSWLPNTDNAKIKLLDGKRKGTIFGIQNWETYHGIDGKVQFKPNRDIWFHLPTMEYFFEFPFRIPEAEIIQYAGTRSFNGVGYELLFFTWKSESPHKLMDQYLVYVHPETHLIDFLELTVRDQAKWARATVRFLDFTQVEGFTFPKRLQFYFQNKLPGKTLGHQIVLSDIFLHQSFDPAAIIRDSTRRSTKFGK